MNILSVLLILFTMNTMLLFDFNTNASLRDWYIVDDVVMGGRSDGRFFMNDEGHGVFKGSVSLENNGGFSSVRYRFSAKELTSQTKVKLKVKGDGKLYQFRVKSSVYERFSYNAEFQTSGDWEIIELNLNEMYPAFRGRKLNLPNYPAKQLNEIAILIGNKKAESFELLIDQIILE